MCKKEEARNDSDSATCLLTLFFTYGRRCGIQFPAQWECRLGPSWLQYKVSGVHAGSTVCLAAALGGLLRYQSLSRCSCHTTTLNDLCFASKCLSMCSSLTCTDVDQSHQAHRRDQPHIPSSRKLVLMPRLLGHSVIVSM